MAIETVFINAAFLISSYSFFLLFIWFSLFIFFPLQFLLIFLFSFQFYGLKFFSFYYTIIPSTSKSFFSFFFFATEQKQKTEEATIRINKNTIVIHIKNIRNGKEKDFLFYGDDYKRIPFFLAFFLFFFYFSFFFFRFTAGNFKHTILSHTLTSS